MNLAELKQKSATELLALAQQKEIDALAGLGKQDLIYAILQEETKRDGEIYSEGVLERLPDGYGFLRSPTSSYLPVPVDI